MSSRIGITATPGTNADRPADVLNRAYIDAVSEAGGVPLVLPILGPEHVDAMLDCIDGLVMSGGGDIDPRRYGQTPVPEVGGVDEARDEWELALVRAAMQRGLPVLGICRGAQVLNVACGGSLVQDLPSISDHPHRATERWDESVHPVEVDPGSKLAEVIDVRLVGVNTLHHQAVAEVGRGLCAVAWAEDGTIEAIECDDSRPVLGVQWHPELLTAFVAHRRLFEWVVRQSEISLVPQSGAGPLDADGGERAVA